MTPLQKLKKLVSSNLEGLNKDDPSEYCIRVTLATVDMWINTRLLEEEQMIKDAMRYALDEDGHTGDWKHKFVNDYYDQLSKTEEENKDVS